MGRPRWVVLRWVLALAQTYFRLRENQQFFLTLATPMLRGSIAVLGRRLADEGLLEQADDAYFLEPHELDSIVRAGLSGVADAQWPPGRARALVGGRRRELDRHRRHEPPVTLGADPQPAGGAAAPERPHRGPVRTDPAEAGQAGQSPTPGILSGTAASAGIVEGRVRLVRGPADFTALRPGEVLLAPATTPAWTPLFGVAAGLVTEYGGMLSHAGVVAREYGLPAVLGVTGALAALRAGDLVRVDGTAGVLTVLARSTD